MPSSKAEEDEDEDKDEDEREERHAFTTIRPTQPTFRAQTRCGDKPETPTGMFSPSCLLTRASFRGSLVVCVHLCVCV